MELSNVVKKELAYSFDGTVLKNGKRSILVNNPFINAPKFYTCMINGHIIKDTANINEAINFILYQ